MAQVQITATYDKYAATAKIFHDFLERQYFVSSVLESSKGRDFSHIYRIYLNKKFGDVTDESHYQYDQIRVKKTHKLIFEYNIRTLEKLWIDKICELTGLRHHNKLEINSFIRHHRDELIDTRKELIDSQLLNILKGFRDSRYRDYILMNPSKRMLAAGICAITYKRY